MYQQHKNIILSNCCHSLTKLVDIYSLLDEHLRHLFSMSIFVNLFHLTRRACNLSGYVFENEKATENFFS